MEVWQIIDDVSSIYINDMIWSQAYNSKGGEKDHEGKKRNTGIVIKNVLDFRKVTNM
jgi:hypothetical protein